MAGQHKRGIPRTQTALLPPAIEDYAGAHSVVRVIDAYVNGLDMVALGFVKSVPAHTGRPAYAPDDLLRLYLYGYYNGVVSSRKLEAECQRNLELMWLLGQLAPDHKTIAEFRRVNGEMFSRSCKAFIELLRQAKLVGGEEQAVVAIDGSKFQAAAAKNSVMNAEQLKRERQKVAKKIAEYLEKMDEVDRQEDAEPQPTAQQIEAALERLRNKQRKLDQAQNELAEREAQAGKEQTPRVALTDPDCVMLIGKGQALVGYNVQHAVDAKHKFIVAHEVTTLRNDQTSLEPMASQAQDALQAPSLMALTDTGYMNGKQSLACEDGGIVPVVPMAKVTHTEDGKLYPKSRFVYDKANDSYRCPAGALLTRYKHDRTSETDYYHTASCASCAVKAQCTKSTQRSIARSWFADAAERADERARTRPWLMRLRSATVEHTFANLKAMLGGRFSLRTLPKVRGEAALAVLTYNLKRAVAVVGVEQLTHVLRMRRVLNPT